MENKEEHMNMKNMSAKNMENNESNMSHMDHDMTETDHSQMNMNHGDMDMAGTDMMMHGGSMMHMGNLKVKFWVSVVFSDSSFTVSTNHGLTFPSLVSVHR